MELLSATRQLASYVQGHCQDDLVILLGSGFDAVKAKSPSQVPATPENQRLNATGITGEMQLKFDRVQYAVNYTVQTAESSDGPWVDQGLSTASRVTLDGFTPGKIYWGRACANGSQGTSDFGGPATGMAM